MIGIKTKKGNAWVGIILLMSFLITLGLALTTDAVVTITQSKKAAQTLIAQSLCDAGIEKAVWKLNNTGGGYIGETDLDLGTGIIDIEITNIDNENKNILVTSYVPSKISPKTKRTIRAKITAEKNESGLAFHYGIQVGELGLEMSNNAKVIGNVYSGGNIRGGNGSQIFGAVSLSGIGNKIDGIEVGCDEPDDDNLGNDGGDLSLCPVDGDIHSHAIYNSYIHGDAYYFSNTYLINSIIEGTLYPGSETSEPIGLPMSANDIDLWKSWAESGGTYSGNYVLDGNSVTESLGPKKIDGNMTATNLSHLTLTGVVWVTGDLVLSQNAIIGMDPSFGPSSTIIVVDGTITTENNVVINGSGNSDSYIMLLSTSISDPAINVANNSDSVVYYASDGYIDVANNAKIRSITAKGINLKNGAIVQYDSGLANANFSAGPGGSWVITEWQIIH